MSRLQELKGHRGEGKTNFFFVESYRQEGRFWPRLRKPLPTTGSLTWPGQLWEETLVEQTFVDVKGCSVIGDSSPLITPSWEGVDSTGKPGGRSEQAGGMLRPRPAERS